MGRFPDDTLSEIRSPRKALSDLVVKYNSASPYHPNRPVWERMIRQLECEIVVRSGLWPGFSRQSGLC
jgi:hypothetical protein